MMRVACCSADISGEKKPTDGAVDGLRAAVGAQIARPGVCGIVPQRAFPEQRLLAVISAAMRESTP